MRACAGAENANKKRLRALFQTLCTAWVLCLCACTGSFETEPLVEFSTEVVVGGAQPHSIARQLDAGTWLLEVRERDVDLRVKVEAGGARTELADAFLRHGVHRMVVSLPERSRFEVTLVSTDQREWKGAAAVRILRWPASEPDAEPDHRLLGFRALGEGSAVAAQDNAGAWRSALGPLREAERQFQAAGDIQ